MTTKEIVSEYVLDEETGKMVMVKQKINEKNLPPNTDIIKLIYQHFADDKTDYDKMTDQELEAEKQRLIKELKESNSDSRKSKTKN